MTQNTQNQRGKNLILISNSSGRLHQNDLPSIVSRNSSFASQFGNLTSNNLGRQSSMGNLFRTFNNPEKPKEELSVVEQKMSEFQRYAQECLEYQKYHFDDRIKLIIHRMAIKAYQNLKEKHNDFLSFSIQKLLGIIAKKLLLNRFQLLFLEYVFEETKWRYDIECISRHSNEYLSYAHVSDSQGVSEATKKLEIYLLYCSFYSKKSLNDFPSENIFNGYLKSLASKFKDYFQEWTQLSNVSNIKINPKILNNIFKRLTFYSGRDSEQMENYCLLVEEIIEISPAYNAQKGAKKRKTSKPKKQELLQQIKQNESQSLLNKVKPQSEQFEQIPNLRNKKQTSYVSNVDGLDPQIYFRGTQKMI